jgi:hypothetical protein
MRSDDFPPHKSRPDELRVMVIGDSVVNGGVQSDQSRTVTALLQRRLASDLGRPVVVGNISAGTWGPPNELAYVKKFGLFDADADYGDAPTFSPIVGVDPAFPDRKPALALQEGVSRYLLPRLRHAAPATQPAGPTPQEIEWCLRATRELIDTARSSGAAVVVAQHLEKGELDGRPNPGHEELKSVAERAGATIVQLGPAEKRARDAGRDPYRDNIHLTEGGNQLVADELAPAITTALLTKSATTRP